MAALGKAPAVIFIELFILCSFITVLVLADTPKPTFASKLEHFIEDVEYFDPKSYDPMRSYFAPKQVPKKLEAGATGNLADGGYVLTNERLKLIRSEFLYPFYDRDTVGTHGDYVADINDNSAQVHKQLNFLLPFFGFGFNYTWLSLHGYLGFSDSMHTLPSPPLRFPVPNWPKDNDPSFIGPFYSRCRLGQLDENDVDKRMPGVYFRLERDLVSRVDQLGVEMRERLKWDIREAIVGSDTFIPKHAVIVTWKNISFVGAYNAAKKVTNSFQMVLVTDEVRSYALMNYARLGWTTNTEAGGDSITGQGGTPAFVGFNAGNGTRAYEYKPYSQDMRIRDLPFKGFANGFPGRHIFRVDEKVMSGSCFEDETIYTTQPLMFAPESGNMLGGIMVNVTGPCFFPGQRIKCRFDTQEVLGKYVNVNRVVCVMPRVYAVGYIDLAIAIDGGQYNWKGRFYVETPITAPEMVYFEDNKHHELYPERLSLKWDKKNLTMDESAKVRISIWGYREPTLRPELIYIDELYDTSNTGQLSINPSEFAGRDNKNARGFEIGLIMINLTSPVSSIDYTPVLWSKPMPLGWYFAPQWKKYEGNEWAANRCRNWIKNDRNFRTFAYELPFCPCMLHQAISDKGRYLPDYECDRDGNAACFYHKGAQTCFRSGVPNYDGAGQQCCYDKDGLLMMTADNLWGGNPSRVHNLGLLPWNEASKIPSLSHWYHDVAPYYTCCLWQSEDTSGCETFRFERRASQDCVGYQPPGVAAVFGDPHFYTFDNFTYTFNGMGEFVLVRANSVRHKFDAQARFEPVPNNVYGTSRATVLTAIAAQENTSVPVEVRIRPAYAQWRYRLDVFVEGRPVYFDSYNRRTQNFKGVTVYTPTTVLNQGHVIMMFASGAGVEVVERNRHLTARVYLPLTFANQTRGLFGNWSFDMTDEFVLPDGRPGPSADMSNMQRIHDEFGLKWAVDDKMDENKGKSLFLHEYGRTSNFYYDPNFRPIFDVRPSLPPNMTSLNTTDVDIVCGASYQCYYDYVVTLNRDYGLAAKNYLDEIVNIKSKNLMKVLSCGALPAPKHGRKSTFAYTPGTFVKFDCDPGYIIVGEDRRWCYASAEWNWAVWGNARCIPEKTYRTQKDGRIAGIVLGVLLPILILLLCFCCCYRRHKRGESVWPFTTRSSASDDSFQYHSSSKSKAKGSENHTNTLPATWTPGVDLGTPPVATKAYEPELTSPKETTLLVRSEASVPNKARPTLATILGRDKVDHMVEPPPLTPPLSDNNSGTGTTDSFNSDPRSSPNSPDESSGGSVGNGTNSDRKKKARRRYQNSYYTNEPLPNRPDIVFEEKEMEVEFDKRPSYEKPVPSIPMQFKLTPTSV